MVQLLHDDKHNTNTTKRKEMNACSCAPLSNGELVCNVDNTLWTCTDNGDTLQCRNVTGAADAGNITTMRSNTAALKKTEVGPSGASTTQNQPGTTQATASQ